MADLRNLYGEHCKVEQVTVRAFGHQFPFIRVGASALLRAVIQAYEVDYDVYSIWAYNCRLVTGGSSWSVHAWAAAVDINPERNPNSTKAHLITNMPTAFVRAFKDHGFGWGGDWHSIKDPMHMSLAPLEQGRGIKEPYDPGLQVKADAIWSGRSTASPPAPKLPGQTAPPWHHEHPGNVERPHPECGTVRRWQRRMRQRGWEIDVDGLYGPQSEVVSRAFQREKSLVIDGILGPATWRCSWECPIV